MSRINVAQLIDHAINRCGVPTSSITPEILLHAKNNIQFSLLDFLNNGVPIYEVQPLIVGLEPKKWIYDQDTSVYDVFNLNWRTMNHDAVMATGGTGAVNLIDNNWNTFAITTNMFSLFQINGPQYDTTAITLSGSLNNLDIFPLQGSNNIQTFDLLGNVDILSEANYIDYWGINPVGDQVHSFVIEASSDNINWEIIQTYTDYQFTNGKWLWVDLITPIIAAGLRIRLIDANPTELILRGFYMGSKTRAYEQPAAKMNRSDFFAYPTKGQSGTPINYFFLRNKVPQIQLWQSTQGANVFRWCLSCYVMYSPNFEIALPEELPIPQWYFNAVVWALASKICYEMPNISADRISLIQNEAQKAIRESQNSNSDTSPINVVGNAIGRYNIIR